MSFSTLRIPVWIVLGLLFAGSVSIALHVREAERLQLHFERDVDDKITALQRELALSSEVLFMLRGLYDASDFVSRDEFARIARNVLIRHNTLQALEWVPRVPEAERFKWEGAARKLFPDFQFTALAAQGALQQSVQKKDFFFPVYYLEPLAGNEAALGFDLSSDPMRNQALERARDTGDIVATRGVQLVQFGEKEKGILFLVPTFRDLPTTRDGRREKLYGYVLGVFRVSRLFDHALSRTAAIDLHLRLIDVTDADNLAESGELLYETPRVADREIHPDYYYERDLEDVAGRSWRMQAYPHKRYVSHLYSMMPFTVFGLLATVILAAALIMRISQQQSIRVQREVEARTRELNEANDKLARVSLTDALTGVANRRAFDEYVLREWRRAVREQHAFAMLLIDVDCFKEYNDFYGHQQGDVALRNVAGALQSALRRPTDMLARYGGEEFVVVLPEPEHRLKPFADFLRASVEALQIPHLMTLTNRKVVTVSIGICVTRKPDQDGFARLLRSADQALYEAKASGRNCVVNAPLDSPAGPVSGKRDGAGESTT